MIAFGSAGRSRRFHESGQSAEPIEEPVKNIESQTETLIESLKSLPQDQLEAIKKQVFKEVCQSLEN